MCSHHYLLIGIVYWQVWSQGEREEGGIQHRGAAAVRCETRQLFSPGTQGLWTGN